MTTSDWETARQGLAATGAGVDTRDLVELMLLDTEKHATILRFLERHAGAH